MTINYPNGIPKRYQKEEKIKKKQKPSFSNRGMSFEEFINQSNLYYLSKEMAVVHKKPTPIQIVHVNYPNRSAAVITEAYFREASTTDYNGVYKGRYLDFEAKETKNKTSFPLHNFHAHQIKHMKQCINHHGIVFVLIWFSSLQRCFFLSANHVIDYWENSDTQRKSLPLKMIENYGYEIQLGVAPIVPYLSIIDHYILKGDSIYEK
ncbi:MULTISPECIES: Holliday junction resolvase RecU [Enterococcaceae]|uniref:Holliday junction resolvase RecU n=1 Tax=Enterococcaceae TaxID=81852 RepID=UPI000E4FF60F|nr:MULTISPECIES: Holliday junction resolvase RecU [Enterococcaceae]MCI0130659.1 Holliday junction resolvase RecU [Vagococcus sp. CY53-2]RGI32366.1 Holliday junction resolvase RecU [Melissococcus sp. OM08-11BH]UNM90081.1 Holliday junction resolvase RecU [Vagococcus sp. CY52-2]